MTTELLPKVGDKLTLTLPTDIQFRQHWWQFWLPIPPATQYVITAVTYNQGIEAVSLGSDDTG